MMRGQAVTAQPTTPAVAPQLDRSKAILFMGVGLIAANFLTANPSLLGTIFAPEANFVGGRDTLPNLVVQGIGIAALYLVSRISDLAGTAAILFLAALWLLFIYQHASAIEGYLMGAKKAGGGAGGTGKLQ